MGPRAKIDSMTNSLASLLDWYVAMGADEAIDLEPHDHTTTAVAKPLSPQRISPPPPPASVAPLVAPSAAAARAREIAERAQTLAELVLPLS